MAYRTTDHENDALAEAAKDLTEAVLEQVQVQVVVVVDVVEQLRHHSNQRHREQTRSEEQEVHWEQEVALVPKRVAVEVERGSDQLQALGAE